MIRTGLGPRLLSAVSVVLVMRKEENGCGPRTSKESLSEISDMVMRLEKAGQASFGQSLGIFQN